MSPFDPPPADNEKIPIRKGSDGQAPPAAQDKEHIMNNNDNGAADSRHLGGDDALPRCWQLGPGEATNQLYIYGPKAARLETPPPDNAQPPEPDAEVGEALTERQLAFCELYVECPVASRAAASAGYSAKTASQQASRLLKHPLIMRRILELRRKRHLEQAYRRETLMDKLEVVFSEAIERREFYAAIQALTMQARMAGIAEAMPGLRYVRAAGSAREQVIWDAVGRLEQKLSEIEVGDYPGAGAAVPPAGKSR